MYMTGLFYKYSYIYIYVASNQEASQNHPWKWFLVKKTKDCSLNPWNSSIQLRRIPWQENLDHLWSWLVNLTPRVSHLPPLEIFGLNSRPYGNQWVFIVFISPDHKALVSMGFSHLWLPNSPNITGNLGTWQMMNKRSTRTQNVLKKPPKTWRFNLTTIGNGLGILGDSSLNSQVT